jgi:PAS domain-containing protein
VLTAEGRTIYVSPSVVNVLGYNDTELIDSSLLDLALS